MKIIRSTWRRGAGGKLIVGLGSLITACFACSCLTLAIPSPARTTPTPAPAAQLAAVVTLAASPTTQVTSTPAPTVEPTEAPTATAEPATATPIPPTATEPSLPRAEPTQTPTEAPVALPTEVATTEIATEVPTQAPTEAPAITNPVEVTPAFSDGIGGANSRVDPPWWPCSEGQFKANINSGIYHVPSGRDYSKTWKNVTCYNTPEEAEANSFRAAGHKECFQARGVCSKVFRNTRYGNSDTIKSV